MQHPLWKAVLALAAAVGLAGCDPQRISELEEGVSTEADVRARFGQPENVWDEPGGARTLEYNRQPAGHQNYMITIGPDGKMAALRQVLNRGTFAKVQPGMRMEEVRRMLGREARRTPYPLKQEEAWDWRFMDQPTAQMIFTVYFDRDWRVTRTAIAVDPDAPGNRGPN